MQNRTTILSLYLKLILDSIYDIKYIAKKEKNL